MGKMHSRYAMPLASVLSYKVMSSLWHSMHKCEKQKKLREGK